MDYLLKGIEPMPDVEEEKGDARIFAAVGSALNFIGLVAAIIIWMERQTVVSVAVGLILMAIGCLIFAIGQFIGERKKISALYFGMVNIWFLSLIPISCIFNCLQGVFGGHWWTFTPIPQLANSYLAFAVCWLIYFLFCISVDVMLAKRKAL